MWAQNWQSFISYALSLSDNIIAITFDITWAVKHLTYIFCNNKDLIIIKKKFLQFRYGNEITFYQKPWNIFKYDDAFGLDS